AEARDTGLQLFDEVRLAVERSGQHAMPVPLSEAGERLDEEVLPLVAAENPDAHQVAGDGTGRGIDPIDAGPGDVHPVARDRVSGQYLLAGPFAGNDHAGGRAEHHPFGALRAGIVVRVEGGGQWHVQQHCHSYPAEVWQQLRGGRRGDEPVDHDGLTIGDGGNDAGQVGQGARAGYRPRRGHGRDQHIPSGPRQSGADAPVVDVAAGRLAGIVEPLGDYYADPHDVPGPPERLPHQTSLYLAAGLNHTRRRSVISDTEWHAEAVDAVRPDTTGVRSTRARRGTAGSSAGPGGTGSAMPGTVRGLT